NKKVGVWFPANDFYPRYIADPLRPQNALTIQWLSDTEMVETGAQRFGLRLGGSFGIRRWHPEGEPDKGWQLSFEGGFAGQFDITWSWDNTGWDGFYGLYLSRMISPKFGFRVGSQHDSSHIGDEYSERTGIKRIHYTREEALIGAVWNYRPTTTFYSELGWGNGLRGGMTFRLEAGAQFVSAQNYWKGRASHFAAIDFRTYEETDWSARLTVQAGYWIPVGDRSSVHRVAIEWGTGRSVMGQFLWEKETWFAIGWYYDF
ncbi:MAG: DUF1207 domain-containing protein, partial [Thermoanaerobaculales bacterium]|nr:DUF1207 domain-containing protein [Thermoanaerobaculales bacterium]